MKNQQEKKGYLISLTEDEPCIRVIEEYRRGIKHTHLATTMGLAIHELFSACLSEKEYSDPMKFPFLSLLFIKLLERPHFQMLARGFLPPLPTQEKTPRKVEWGMMFPDD